MNCTIDTNEEIEPCSSINNDLVHPLHDKNIIPWIKQENNNYKNLHRMKTLQHEITTRRKHNKMKSQQNENTTT
jgi:hypothetical protein